MPRSALGSMVFLFFAVVLASPARAVPVPFTGSLLLQVRALRFEVSGSGVAEVDSVPHPTRISIPAGVFAVQGSVVSVPTSIQASAFPVVALQVTIENQAGVFSQRANGFGGAMPLLGLAKVCLFKSCASALANVSVPLSVVGAGGSADAQGPVNVTVGGAPWTTNDTVTGARTAHSTFTTMGFRRGPASNSSSTAAPSGAIQLVTPVFVSTDLGSEPTVATFGRLRLHFVPEPGTLALLGSGVVVLGVRGIRRARGAGPSVHRLTHTRRAAIPRAHNDAATMTARAIPLSSGTV